MANGSSYDFGAAFGLLTALLEDTVELAVEGQSSRLSTSARRQLVIEVDISLKKVGRVLEEIKQAL